MKIDIIVRWQSHAQDIQRVPFNDQESVMLTALGNRVNYSTCRRGCVHVLGKNLT